MSEILAQLAGAGGGAPPEGDLPLSIPDPGAGGASPDLGGMMPPDLGGGLPPELGEPAPEPEGGGDEVGTLKELIGLADSYKSIGTVTEGERAQMEKVTTILQTLLAQNEKMSDQLTGATPALRKAYGGPA